MGHNIPNVASALKAGAINSVVFYTFDHTLLEKKRFHARENEELPGACR